MPWIEFVCPVGQFVRLPDLAAFEKGQLAPTEPGTRRSHVQPINSSVVFLEHYRNSLN